MMMSGQRLRWIMRELGTEARLTQPSLADKSGPAKRARANIEGPPHFKCSILLEYLFHPMMTSGFSMQAKGGTVS
jgi:hypothetical protein